MDLNLVITNSYADSKGVPPGTPGVTLPLYKLDNHLNLDRTATDLLSRGRLSSRGQVTSPSSGDRRRVGMYDQQRSVGGDDDTVSLSDSLNSQSLQPHRHLNRPLLSSLTATTASTASTALSTSITSTARNSSPGGKTRSSNGFALDPENLYNPVNIFESGPPTKINPYGGDNDNSSRFQIRSNRTSALNDSSRYFNLLTPQSDSYSDSIAANIIFDKRNNNINENISSANRSNSSISSRPSTTLQQQLSKKSSEANVIRKIKMTELERENSRMSLISSLSSGSLKSLQSSNSLISMESSGNLRRSITGSLADLSCYSDTSDAASGVSLSQSTSRSKESMSTTNKIAAGKVSPPRPFEPRKNTLDDNIVERMRRRSSNNFIRPNPIEVPGTPIQVRPRGSSPIVLSATTSTSTSTSSNPNRLRADSTTNSSPLTSARLSTARSNASLGSSTNTNSFTSNINRSDLNSNNNNNSRKNYNNNNNNNNGNNNKNDVDLLYNFNFEAVGSNKSYYNSNNYSNSSNNNSNNNHNSNHSSIIGNNNVRVGSPNIKQHNPYLNDEYEFPSPAPAYIDDTSFITNTYSCSNDNNNDNNNVLTYANLHPINNADNNNGSSSSNSHYIDLYSPIQVRPSINMIDWDALSTSSSLWDNPISEEMYPTGDNENIDNNIVGNGNGDGDGDGDGYGVTDRDGDSDCRSLSNNNDNRNNSSNNSSSNKKKVLRASSYWNTVGNDTSDVSIAQNEERGMSRGLSKEISQRGMSRGNIAVSERKSSTKYTRQLIRMVQVGPAMLPFTFTHNMGAFKNIPTNISKVFHYSPLKTASNVDRATSPYFADDILEQSSYSSIAALPRRKFLEATSIEDRLFVSTRRNLNKKFEVDKALAVTDKAPISIDYEPRGSPLRRHREVYKLPSNLK